METLGDESRNHRHACNLQQKKYSIFCRKHDNFCRKYNNLTRFTPVYL